MNAAEQTQRPPTFFQSLQILGSKPKFRDLLSASPLVVWYVYCLTWQVPAVVRDGMQLSLTHIDWFAALDIASRIARFMFAALLTTLMIVRCTAIKKHQSFAKRAIAFFGCYVGIGAQVLPTVPGSPALAVASGVCVIFGMGFATFSLLYLGRSISIMPESRKLVMGGPYSIVRHPLYVGEQLAVLGIALQCRSILVLAILTLQFACQLYRMTYEEEILVDTFPEYKDYSARTARLIPGLY
jgi:protein-S-isoprenylcysteine O-methyltransferase Ste14